jgi:isoamylase/glycogen operon protein
MNYSGCGNTVQGNHSVVQQFIRDSLRYWVTEMHVDGFRFDLASILTRGKQGVPLSNPPLVQSITEDPLLADIKLIAEAWDAGGLYQVGNFPAEGGWAEWNGQYRDHVRRFIKGEASHSGNFATRIAGSQDLYGRGRHPFHSINFITAHDGFSLADLVSYNHKHNIANGENNQDGANDNESWNCGVEGETKDSHVLELRRKQLKNFHLALIASQGVPMINMGDEYGHTKRGNNNTWCQDNDLNWFSWKQWEHQKSDLFRFFSLLNHFRLNNPLLRQENFLTAKDITWHGAHPGMPDWSPMSKLVAFTLHDNSNEGKHLYIAFNASHVPITVHLPVPGKKTWYRIVDSSCESPEDFLEPGQERAIYPKALEHEPSYKLKPYSSILCQLKSSNRLHK